MTAFQRGCNRARARFDDQPPGAIAHIALSPPARRTSRWLRSPVGRLRARSTPRTYDRSSGDATPSSASATRSSSNLRQRNRVRVAAAAASLLGEVRRCWQARNTMSMTARSVRASSTSSTTVSSSVVCGGSRTDDAGRTGTATDAPAPQGRDGWCRLPCGTSTVTDSGRYGRRPCSHCAVSHPATACRPAYRTPAQTRARSGSGPVKVA